MTSPRKLDVIALRSDIRMLSILAVIFVPLGAWLIAAVYQDAVDNEGGLFTTAIGVIIMAISVIYFLLPIFIGNIVTETRLILRFGILFRLELPLGEIAEMAIEEGGLKGKMNIVQDPKRIRKADVMILVCDATKAKNELGWGAQIPIEKTIRDMIEYHLSRKK